MKKTNAFYLVSLLLSAILFSCQGTNRQPGGDNEPQQNETPPADAQGLITDAGQLPDIIDYEGNFQQAARWPGQGSNYYAIVSKLEQGDFFSPSWSSRLNFYLFEVNGGQIISRRAFQAESPNIYSTVDIKGGQSQLVSLPSMGTAFSVVYSICPDGEDPCSIFSSVIGTDGKYDFQILENVGRAVYLEAQDAMMAGIPEDVRQHMLKQLFGME